MIDCHRCRPQYLPLLALPLLALAVPAQNSGWTRVKDAPSGLVGIHYDTVHRRAVGFEEGAPWPVVRTWSFDGTRWRQHTPDGLPASSIALIQGAVYDRGHGHGVAVTINVATGPRTFTGDGAGWRLAAGAFSPAPDDYATFAYDPVRNQVITFGGIGSPWSETDTMSAWTGSSWAQLSPAVRPAPRTGCGMVMDSGRNRVVLFGGSDSSAQNFLGDTWEWNGTSWAQSTPGTSPSPRRTMLGYDPATQQVVALGGHTAIATLQDCWGWNGSNWAPRGQLPAGPVQGAYDDGTNLFVVAGDAQANVWRANGSAWTAVFTDLEPNQRGTMAYDPTRGEVLLAGGQAGADTWRWDGAWHLVSAAGPGPRRYPAMAALGAEMIFTGGDDDNLGPVFDTWAWNGTAWTQRAPAHQPSPRSLHAMATVGNQVLLFGGRGGQELDDTWSYDGVDWTQLAPVHQPLPRFAPGLAHDPSRGRTVLYGGQTMSSSTFQDTWEWNGVDWVQIWSMTTPQTFGASLAYDPVRAQILLPQGSSGYAWDGVDWSALPGSPLHVGAEYPIAAAYDLGRQRLLALDLKSSLYVYGPTPADAVVATQSCGNRPDLRSFGAPAIGRTPLVHVEGAANTLAFVAYGFSTALVNYAPGCDQKITVDAVFAGVTDARGELSVPFPIPAALGLRGVLVHSQAVVLDGGPVYGASLSGALSLRIGD